MGGVVGTTSNSDLPTYVGGELQVNGDENVAGQSGNRDNKIDESKEQIEVVAGTITDVSVAVTINQNAPTANSVELLDLRGHVARAAGIGGEEPQERVSVLIAPFADSETADDIVTPWLAITPDMLPFIIIGGIALLVLLLVLILVLRGRRKKKAQQLAEEQALAEAEAAAAEQAAGEFQPIGAEGQPGEGPPMTGADIMEINTEKSLELRKTVRQFAQNNPEIAAQMLKNWLREEDGNGR